MPFSKSNQLANSVDAHVGQRIRERRRDLKLSQRDLAAGVHLSFQQIQKYEQGINRVSASTIADLARALRVTASWFFAGLDVEPENTPGMLQADDRELLRRFHALGPLQRSSLLNVAQAMNVGAPVGHG